MARSSKKVSVDTGALRRLFAQMIKRNESFDPVFVQAIRALEMEHGRHFATNGGGAWAPLAASTVAEKNRKGFGEKGTLERTGALRSSLSYGFLSIGGGSWLGGPMSQSSIRDQTATTLEFGTSLEYASYHFKGANGPGRRTMPARSPLVLPETFAFNVASDTGGWIVYGYEWETKRNTGIAKNLNDLI